MYRCTIVNGTVEVDIMRVYFLSFSFVPSFSSSAVYFDLVTVTDKFCGIHQPDTKPCHIIDSPDDNL